MARSSSRNRIKVDWVVVLLYAILVLWGWISIYAAVFNEEAVSILNLTQEYGKQLIFMLTSLVIIGAILISNYRLWTNFAPLWYFLTMLLLVGVLFVGKKIGAVRVSDFGLRPKFDTLTAPIFSGKNR